MNTIIPHAWAVVMIRVGLAQALSNYNPGAVVYVIHMDTIYTTVYWYSQLWTCGNIFTSAGLLF